MPSPTSIVFISRNRVLPGKLDAVRAFMAAGTPALEAGKPRTHPFLPYLDDAGERLTIIHVFADAESFDLHLAGADDRSNAAYELIAPEGFELYGRTSEAALESFRQWAAGSGIPLELFPGLPAGFLRGAG